MKYEECVYCKGIIYLKEKDEHEIQCGAKTEQCKRCGEFVVVKNKEQHLKWECGVAERKYCDNNYIEYVYKGKKGKKKGKKWASAKKQMPKSIILPFAQGFRTLRVLCGRTSSALRR